ncbi:hypothetical protein [uncultured Microbacterium sp.]|uniref:hypothetical protein n=1 Tax=uncultured Microbacterium sp. TaxID=191216 RepID=UPI0025CD48EE|nr:hypothetical protein [uncultured Microbacterium sp.]
MLPSRSPSLDRHHNSVRSGRIRSATVAATSVITIAAIWSLIISVPGLAVVLDLLFVIGVVAVALVSVPIGILIAIELPPVKPLADVSILGKNIVGFGKLAIGLLAFFGNTALAWIIALSVAAKPDTDVASVQGQLWPLLASLVGAIAYVFWVWIAIDLTRAGRQARMNAVDSLADRTIARTSQLAIIDRPTRRFAK